MMTRLNKRDRGNDIPENNLPILSSDDIPEVKGILDSESVEDITTTPVVRKHYFRQSSTNRSVRRSQKIAGKQPQYMGLLCHIEGGGDFFDVEALYNVVKR